MSDALVPELAPPAQIAAEPLQVKEASLAPRSEAAARDRPHVVVVGAGFAGLHSIRALAGTEVSVTVVDRHNYHLFQPLLYQVATAALEPADISGQLRQVIRGENIQVLMAEVDSIDAERNRLELSDGSSIDFDYLILASGS